MRVTGNDIDGLGRAIEKAHSCKAVHVATAPVNESFQGQSVWQGFVEEFQIRHSQTDRCYAWCIPDKTGESIERYVTVLAVPPISSPMDAVRAFIASELKRQSGRSK